MKQFEDHRASVDCHLLYLKEQACRYPANDVRRQLYLTKLIRCIQQSGRLWQEATPYYEDALQMTWVYCCQNLCEPVTAKSAYDSSLASLITWLNNYLKWRLYDLTQERQAELKQVDLSDLPDSSAIWDSAQYRAEVPSILEDTQAWVEADVTGELRSLSLKNHPQVTAQYLMLQRLPPETSWQALSDELGVSISTLSSFYRRHCLPTLRKFAKKQGYL